MPSYALPSLGSIRSACKDHSDDVEPLLQKEVSFNEEITNQGQPRKRKRTERISQHDAELNKKKDNREKIRAKKRRVIPQPQVPEDRLGEDDEDENSEFEEREPDPLVSIQAHTGTFAKPSSATDAFDDIDPPIAIPRHIAPKTSSHIISTPKTPSQPTAYVSQMQQAPINLNTPSLSPADSHSTVSRTSPSGASTLGWNGAEPAPEPITKVSRSRTTTTSRRRKPKPCVASFEEIEVQDVLMRARADYKAVLLAVDPYPKPKMLWKLTKGAWERANEYEFPNEPEIPFTADHQRVIKMSAAQIRGHILTCTRPLVPSAYRLYPGEEDEDMVSNRYTIHMLRLNSTFTCREFDFEEEPTTGWERNIDLLKEPTRKGLFEHPLISRAINICIFRDSKDIGPVFLRWFNPINIETIAFFVMIIDHCLREWATGEFVPIYLNASSDKAAYDSHLSSIRHLSSKAPRRVRNICRRLTKSAKKHAKITAAKRATPPPMIRDDDIESDLATDEETTTDDEEDDE